MEQSDQKLRIIALAKDDDCPSAVRTRKALTSSLPNRAYFNETYAAFKRELEQYTAQPNKRYSNDRVEILSSRVASNASSSEVWKRYVSIKPPRLNEDVRQTTTVRTAL
ncbi:MAG: hypothetical protein JWO28_1901 [Hyphomicrobiales bacterium]|nr:hypothetical protein [Hyphomicrobiales bacterium]